MRERLIVAGRTVHHAIAPHRRVHAHIQLRTPERTVHHHRGGGGGGRRVDDARLRSHLRPARLHFQPGKYVVIVIRIDKLHGNGTRSQRLLELLALRPAGAEHFDDIVARRIPAEWTRGHSGAVRVGQDDS